MFVQALEQISKKIGKSEKKEQGYKILEKRIISNPILKKQFELYVKLSENTEKIESKVEYKKFYASLKEGYKDCCYKKANVEIIKLLEFFNINPEVIKTTVMDNAMRLNEVAVKTVVMNEEKQLIEAEFKNIIKENNSNDLRKQFQIVNFLSESIKNKKQKEFTKKSLAALVQESYTDFNNSVKKLYRLRILVEETSEQNKSSLGGGKKISLPDVGKVQRITISTPEMSKKPEQIIISFRIPVYPIGSVRIAAKTSAIRIKKVFENLRMPFIGQFIIEKDRGNLFSTNSTIWNVKLKDQVQLREMVYAKINIYINTNPKNRDTNTLKDYFNAANQMVKEFSKALPELLGKDVNILTPEAQEQALKSTEDLSQRDKQKKARVSGESDFKSVKNKNPEHFNQLVDDFGGAF